MSLVLQAKAQNALHTVKGPYADMIKRSAVASRLYYMSGAVCIGGEAFFKATVAVVDGFDCLVMLK